MIKATAAALLCASAAMADVQRLVPINLTETFPPEPEILVGVPEIPEGVIVGYDICFSGDELPFYGSWLYITNQFDPPARWFIRLGAFTTVPGVSCQDNLSLVDPCNPPLSPIIHEGDGWWMTVEFIEDDGTDDCNPLLLEEFGLPAIPFQESYEEILGEGTIVGDIGIRFVGPSADYDYSGCVDTMDLLHWLTIAAEPYADFTQLVDILTNWGCK